MECENTILQVELTNNCNGECWFCRNKEMTRERGFMSLGTAKEIAELIEGRQDYILLHFYGESLLHPDFIKFVEIFSEKGIKCAVYTNGKCLTDEMIEKISESKLYNLTITLNRFEPYKQIEKLRKNWNGQIIVSVLNIPPLEKEKGFYINSNEAVKWAKKVGVQIQGLSYEYPEKIDGKLACSFKMKNGDCTLRCKNQYSITWKGDVLTCIKDYNGETVVGKYTELDKFKYQSKKCLY